MSGEENGLAALDMFTKIFALEEQLEEQSASMETPAVEAPVPEPITVSLDVNPDKVPVPMMKASV
jgi:hypothetical protein